MSEIALQNTVLPSRAKIGRTIFINKGICVASSLYEKLDIVYTSDGREFIAKQSAYGSNLPSNIQNDNWLQLICSTSHQPSIDNSGYLQIGGV